MTLDVATRTLAMAVLLRLAPDFGAAAVQQLGQRLRDACRAGRPRIHHYRGGAARGRTQRRGDAQPPGGDQRRPGDRACGLHGPLAAPRRRDPGRIGTALWLRSATAYRPDPAELSVEVSCQASVPESIVAFLDSDDFEHAIRLAISLGGDSDTQAAIAGGIAQAFYGHVPRHDCERGKAAAASGVSGCDRCFDLAFPSGAGR